jgi:hypothetical protein
MKPRIMKKAVAALRGLHRADAAATTSSHTKVGGATLRTGNQLDGNFSQRICDRK